MNGAARFPFVDANPSQPGTSLLPLMPLVLAQGGRRLDAVGLLDTGAAVNVLPYSFGKQLGFVWEEQKTPLVLSGNLASLPARGVLITAVVAHFAPVRLVFAWTQADDVRLILGQTNFFLEFDACFFRARSEFEVKPKSAQPQAINSPVALPPP
jgi:hypothetical protein